ncbi:SRPBCC family protein [Roseibium sp. MMSF_3544]|uniref:SRPBCC family protein n=1 Tax=unclassified Roseibium TaxID=2629323 RepID=UPI00273FD4F1|nr:SRPBCC family protein [Roseibium sp. MMSF_3544]
MKIKRTLVINASPEHVWEILGANYTRAGDWASSVYFSSARAGTPAIDGAPVAGRVCQTSLGPFTETIESYDEHRRHLAYSATGDKMPGFVKRLVNSWTVYPMADKSRVEMELSADISFPFNFLMGPMMKMQFGKVLREATEELKHFAETGKAHPRKVKSDASRKAVAARAAFA